MKNIIPIALLFLLSSCTKEKLDPNLIKEFSIQSVSNGASYTIKVALPENFSPDKKYGAIYLLDGEEIFNQVATDCKKYSADYSANNILVVSISYGNNRAYDYTPTKANEGGGGAENFLQFIKNELIPKMESDYNADTLRESRSIIGHSFGGLLAAYAFTNYNNVFGNYIMLSPSIWYDNEVMLRLEQQHRETNKHNRQLVFMGLGELENSGRMLAPYMAFYQRLRDNYPSIKITSHLEYQLDHMGSRTPNTKAGLKFYFQNR